MVPIHINAEPYEPNTFWQGESGEYYRKKKDALRDKPQKAVNPIDYITDGNLEAVERILLTDGEEKPQSSIHKQEKENILPETKSEEQTPKSPWRFVAIIIIAAIGFYLIKKH